PARHACFRCRQVAERRHPRLAVHRRRAATNSGGDRHRRAGDRDSYRRVVRRGGRQPDVSRAGRVAAHSPWCPTGPAPRTRSSCRARPRFRHSRGDYRITRDRRTQHWSFLGRRGSVSRPCRGRQNDASRDRPGARMILGVGSDLIDVRRIERTIERHGERFLTRIFTATERAKADGRVRKAETYAKRFAAKEACAKALGTGLRAGVFWRDMGVINLASGRPTMKHTGGALARLHAITPAGYEARIDVTVSDEG